MYSFMHIQKLIMLHFWRGNDNVIYIFLAALEHVVETDVEIFLTVSQMWGSSRNT